MFKVRMGWSRAMWLLYGRFSCLKVVVVVVVVEVHILGLKLELKTNGSDDNSKVSAKNVPCLLWFQPLQFRVVHHDGR